MANALQQLWNFGQSFWYDNIRRELLTNGELARMVREDGLRGLTSNPTIFAKALQHTADYDASIQVHLHQPAPEVFLELMIEDIQSACDVLRPVFDASQGQDGFASIEVFPALARDAAGTLAQARTLWQRVARPNVMVKIPATPECLPAIAQALREGININITLMFELSSYQEVAEIYLAALEARLAVGAPLAALSSVASLFVSRVDTMLDPLLAQAGAAALAGKAGIANARRMYRHFQQEFNGPRWRRLAEAGARPQRLLWASTSTKNPAYPDTLYADALVGPLTVDTMPDATLAAYRDHGHPADRLGPAVASFDQEVAPVLAGVAAAGIDIEARLLELQNEGVEAFARSFDELIAGLTAKISARAAASAPAAPVPAPSTPAPTGMAARVWRRDASLWSADLGVQAKILNRLGWLTLPATMRDHVGDITAFAASLRAAGFTDAVLLGMGGSSLAPQVFSDVFAGHPNSAPGLRLHLLDTTDPDAILHTEERVDFDHTLFIVSSKSGGTIEPNSLFAYFWSKFPRAAHFIAITDPGTSLERLAAQHGFRRTFLNPPDIGGRYSALSYFGLVPAALVGADIAKLLDRAATMAEACRSDDPAANPGEKLGSELGRRARAAQDKLTLVCAPALASLGSWLEQLIAESTGKQGKGIVPIDGEPLGPAGVYGADRLFVNFSLDGAAAPALPAPALRLALADVYDLGAEMFRWEFAVAVAGAVLGINPFDEPNVQESKDNTMRVLRQYLEGGRAAAGFAAKPAAESGTLQAFVPGNPAAPAEGEDPLLALVAAWLAAARTGDYIAIMAYLERVPALADALQQLRSVLLERTHLATTLGFGPRFLHSTGQLHKGGANTGLFLQITGEPEDDLSIPGQPYSFETLFAAQAMGDYESLASHQRRLLRIDIGHDPAAGLEELIAAFTR